MPLRHPAFTILFALAISAPLAATAWEVSFVDIETPFPANLELQFHAINDHGVVAFGGFESSDDGSRIPTIFSGDGEQPTEARRVVDDSAIFTLAVGALNNRGDIAYKLRRSSGGALAESVRLLRDGEEIVVEPGVRAVDVPRLNDAGAVAYTTSGSSSGSSVRSVRVNLFTDGESNTIAIVDREVFNSLGRGSPALNSLGQLVFLGNSLGSVQELVLVDPDTGDFSFPVTTESAGVDRIGGFDLNDNSTIAFTARFEADQSGLFSYDSEGGLSTIALEGGSFFELGLAFPGINNRGDLVATGLDSSANQTLLYWIRGQESPIPVISVGQDLFGSQVTQLWTSAAALNDQRQVAFGYVLADGRQGIARADLIPEPGAAILAATIAAAGGMRRRSRDDLKEAKTA